MAKIGPKHSEGRRREASPQRIPRPANDNIHPDARRRLLIAAAAVVLSALAFVALSMSGWR
ncbi:hypothetical protein [Magnetospirillum sp. 15-1]|uniref:hypothetical protein n=1 Tax=Magnetospirillum sp. 15-1 TaxID=1979370 RepID=UPI000BBB7F02|nr:hypothetical protein [Magnetospirillum sp. 15-1]